jgi:ribose transport system permease protein
MEKRSLKEYLMKYIMHIVLVLMCIFFAISNSRFLTLANLLIIVKQISIPSLVAIGMTIIIITGNIDLSVGSIVAFVSVCTGLMLKSGVPIVITIILSLVISAGLGFISGIVTAKLKLHSFLVTLALMQAFRGLAQTLTGGYPVAGLPKSFGTIASAKIGNFPLLILYMVVFYVVFIYIMKYTAFGRSIYALGGNEESARLSGINTDRIKTMAFVLSSMLCGVSAILLTSKVRSGDPTAAVGWEMDAIAAAIIGGTDMMGGKGTLGGTVIGLLFVGILSNGMTLLNIQPYPQAVIKGLLIFMAVIINSIQQKSEIA